MEDKKGTPPNREAKFKVGDKVKIVEYGSLMWRYVNNYQKESDECAKMDFISKKRILFNEEASEEELLYITGKSRPDNVYKEVDGVYWIDLNPELVGQEGVIVTVSNTQNIPKYSLSGPNKTAWYNEDQLELISNSEEVVMEKILNEWTKENKVKLRQALDGLLIEGEYKIKLNG